MATKPPVYARINWRQRLLAALRSTSALVAAAYVLKANSVKTSALEADIRRLETERALTVANVKRLASYTALITLTARRFGAFSDDLTGIAQTSIAAGVALGLDAARDMAGVQFGATEAFVMLGWNQPSAAQLARLTGYVESAAWKASASAFGRSAADVLSNVILTGVARGQGPRTIAATMRRALDTVPRVWAETTVRTAQIWGYRTAAHESYRANPDLVRGWIWTAALDSRTCFPAGTAIATEMGAMPIENIRTGDKVLTNSGTYQRVYDTMKRQYNGDAITLTVGDVSVTMTSDHPVLIERDGIRHWVSASDCQTGDSVFLNVQQPTGKYNHLSTDFPVKAGSGNAQNPIALLGEAHNLSHISFAVFMPIRLINLYRKIARRNKEIDGVLGKSGLLFENLTQRLKAQAKVAFRFGLSGIAPIAARGAKLLMSAAWRNTERLSAGEAGVYDRRTAARFAAIEMLMPMFREHLSTPFALNTNGVDISAIGTARPVTIRVGRGYLKTLSADGAGLGDAVSLNGLITRPATKPARPKTGVLKRFAALLASRVYPLILRRTVTCGATVQPSAFFNPSGGDAELFPTVVANSFYHAPIISKVAHHIQCEVYDLSVENDHTFFANGVLVHNCLGCLSQHGTFHTNDETLNGHDGCRCAPIPVVRGVNLSIQTGPEWFDGLSGSTQRDIMGPSRYAAYKAGEFDWNNATSHYTHEPYGDMLRSATLDEMGIERVMP